MFALARVVLAFALALAIVTNVEARNSDWPSFLFGASSSLTCGQFNKLGKNEKEGALSWAFGYVSGMATSDLEARRVGDERTLFDLDLLKELKIIAEIKRGCRKRPSVSFPLMVHSIIPIHV